MSRIPIRSTELVMADRGEVKFAKVRSRVLTSAMVAWHGKAGVEKA